MAEVIRSILGKPKPPSLPPAGTLAGQTILVTGGTSGLGTAAAAHFLALGAKEVIITARHGGASSPRAEAARRTILAAAGSAKNKNENKDQKEGGGEGAVTVMELDMNSYESCVKFVDALEASFGARQGSSSFLDVVVLNAGGANNVFVKSPEGLEETFQVNTVSTTLLALLLLPLLKQQQQHPHRAGPPRLVIIGSGTHTDVDIKPWPSYVEKDGGVLAHFAKAENFPSDPLDSSIYAASKLLVHYATEEVSKLALDGEGKPQVITTIICPGPVQTNLAARMKENSVLARIGAPIFLAVVAKPSDYGARIYVNASVAKPEDHGKYLRYYQTDKQYEAKSAPVMSSPEARKMQAETWKEIKDILVAKVPAVRDTLQQQ